MDSILNYLKHNLITILGFVVLFICLIISSIIIAKKSGGKVSFWDALKARILEQIPFWADLVEQNGNGEAKRQKVLKLAVKEASQLLGRELTAEETNAVAILASEHLEAVLEAPQKKQDPKKKSRYRS